MSFTSFRYTEYCCQCDNCGEMEVLHTGDAGMFNSNQIMKYLRKYGWRIGKTTLCPDCKIEKELGGLNEHTRN